MQKTLCGYPLSKEGQENLIKLKIMRIHSRYVAKFNLMAEKRDMPNITPLTFDQFLDQYKYTRQSNMFNYEEKTPYEKILERLTRK